jgi:hypothetical protein
VSEQQGRPPRVELFTSVGVDGPNEGGSVAEVVLHGSLVALAGSLSDRPQ